MRLQSHVLIQTNRKKNLPGKTKRNQLHKNIIYPVKMEATARSKVDAVSPGIAKTVQPLVHLVAGA
jgi:hypothetical protein